MRLFAKKSAPEVTEEMVEWAYRVALGREPENRAVVAKHRESARSFDDLRMKMFCSPEFRARGYPTPMAPTVGAPAPNIRNSDRPDLRERVFNHIAKSWSHYGETEAHWSVLTFERYREETLKQNIDEFHHSGEAQVKTFLNALARNGLTVPAGGTCIELGCGVGRITRWLAPQFGKVIGVDVSPGHIALAKEYVGRHATNVEFRQLRTIDDLKTLPKAEALYTFLVLQHNPPPVIEAMLEGLFARLAPGAVAFVHLPTHIPDYHFDIESYLAEREDALDMEMHMLPQKDVFRVCARGGMQLLEVLNATNELMYVADCLVLQKT
jgi:2-polyprenyl-3-methyl-5-hydroxy-6-metoxy-1,4-benzoquinol methylase